MNPSTRKDAIADGLNKYFTGVPCVKGHIAERYTNNTRCVDCVAANRKRYRAANPDKVLQNQRQYDASRREAKNQGAREWARRNPEKVAASLRKWREKNQEALAEYQQGRKEQRNESNRRRRKERRLDDPLFALEQTVRGRLGRVFRTEGFRKTSSTAAMLGCTWTELKVHIEKQFRKGMTWDNRGEKWHVDHILPLADATTAEELVALCHFTNLRPLWALDNRKKNAKRLHLI